MPAAIPVRTYCVTCKQTKTPDDFSRTKRTVSGRMCVCKECTKEYQRKWAKTDRGKRAIAAAKAKYKASEHGLESTRSAWRRYNNEKRDPIKMEARNAVRRAIRLGEMQRGDCVKCGAPDAEGHHEDYNKPLDVVWLCKPCHSRLHREGG